MKKLLKLVVVLLCLPLLPLAAQVQLGGHIYVPSTGDSNAGQTNVVFTADGDCNLLAPVNCTVADAGGNVTDAAWLGTLRITSTVTLTAGRRLLVPNSPGRVLNVVNTTAQPLLVSATASGGATLSASFNSSIVNDGTGWQCVVCSAGANVPVASPTVPGLVTTSAGTSGYALSKVATTGQYQDLSNRPPQPTLVAHDQWASYNPLNETIGSTVLHDISGANRCGGLPCDLPLTGTGASIDAQGLNLVGVSEQNTGANKVSIPLPASLVGSVTFSVGTYVPAPPNGQFLVPANWSSSQGSDGGNYWSLLVNPAGGMKIMNGGNYHGFGKNPYIQANNTPTTQAIDSWIGAKAHTFVLGTDATSDPDHIYLNQAEATYILQGASRSGNTSGALSLGAFPQLPNAYATGFPGHVTSLTFYGVELNSAEAIRNDLVINQLAANAGINTSVSPNPSSANTVAFTGDSLFSDIGATMPVGISVGVAGVLNNVYSTYANGLPGWTCAEIQTLVPFREAYLFSSFSGRRIAIAECGNNDAQNGLTPPQIVDAMLALSAQLKLSGADFVFLPTLTSASGLGTSDATLKDVLNPLIRQAAASHGDGVMDFATSSPNIGADSASNNGTTSTYFVDTIHWNQFSKDHYIVPTIANAINEYDGSTVLGGCVKTVTASYQETAVDGCVRVKGTTNPSNIVITLPDCAGYFKPRTIKNISGVNISVVATNSEEIDTSNDPVIVGVYSTLTLYPRAEDTTGTCHWERTP